MLADAAQTDHPHRLARQLVQRGLPQREVGLARPLARPHGLVVKADVVAHFQQEREHKLSDRARAVNRHVRHGNATSAHRRDIHAVKSRRDECDELELGRLVDQLSLNGGLVRDQNRCTFGTRESPRPSCTRKLRVFRRGPVQPMPCDPPPAGGRPTPRFSRVSPPVSPCLWIPGPRLPEHTQLRPRARIGQGAKVAEGSAPARPRRPDSMACPLRPRSPV